MTEYSSRSRCYHAGHYDKYMDASDSNTLTRVQQQYWATKQAVYRKLGKKEDDCIVASDAELDAKLELFKAIEESCTHLMRVLEAYQDKLCAMSHEENALGRFLKENGKQDKTRAGKMMIATGKTLSYTAQQRLALRVPLVRLYQEVETFQYRAITDTCATIDKMEKSRTSYRGALMWMKDVSQQLDPDMYKQMEKFKKVQGHVRKTKSKFEKLKLDTLQKVDLLSASRCNMFSHALAVYQNTLLQFWEKTAHTMNAVADSFRGYQHYEFSMLKELTEPSKKLAEETAGQNVDEIEEGEEVDKDKLIFFEAEYHDDDDDELCEHHKNDEKSDSLQNLLNSSAPNASPATTKKDTSATKKMTDRKAKNKDEAPLLSLAEEAKPENDVNGKDVTKTKKALDASSATAIQANGKVPGTADLLTESTEADDSEKDDMTLLSEILSVPLGDIPLIPASNAEGSFSRQWQAAFGDGPTSPEKPLDTTLQSTAESLESATSNRPTFFPSQLLEATASSMSNLRINSHSKEQTSQQDEPLDSTSHKKRHMSSSGHKKNKQKELSDWFNLFADLDPLANPDSVGKKTPGDDHNC